MQQPANVAMLCLQAQQVAGLPDALEGRRIQLSSTTCTPTAVCRAGVADFHRQLLLLHCAPVSCIDDDVQVTVTVLDHPAAAPARVVNVHLDLAQQLRRPSPSVLSFVLGVITAPATATGAVLSLTLHHRLLVTTTTRTRTGTGACSSLLRSCLRVPLAAAGCCPPLPTNQNRRRHQGRPAEAADHDNQGDGDSSSSGFITIEKGTISRRRPPSDYLLTTDDDEEEEVDGKRPPGPGPPTTCCWSLSSLDDDTKVENDFLAMLMLEEEDDDGGGLDALIEDAEADLAAIWPSRRGSSTWSSDPSAT